MTRLPVLLVKLTIAKQVLLLNSSVKIKAIFFVTIQRNQKTKDSPIRNQAICRQKAV
jgi:hypothetical protein